MPRVSTGLNEFDVELGGGIPPGSVVVIRAPPVAPVELLLGVFAMAQADRATYLTTMRHPARVRRTLEAVSASRSTGDDVSAVSIVDARPPIEGVSEILDALDLDEPDSERDRSSVEIVETDASAWAWDSEPASPPSESSSESGTLGGGSSSEPSREAADDATEYLGEPTGQSSEQTDGFVTDPRMTDGSSSMDEATGSSRRGRSSVASDGGSQPVWVVDSMSTLIESGGEWPEFLWRLEAVAAEMGGVVYLSLRMPTDRTATQAESQVLDMASSVFEYEIERGTSVSHSLLVTRFLGGTPPERRIGLEVSDQIGVNPDRTV